MTGSPEAGGQLVESRAHLRHCIQMKYKTLAQESPVELDSVLRLPVSDSWTVNRLPSVIAGAFARLQRGQPDFYGHEPFVILFL